MTDNDNLCVFEDIGRWSNSLIYSSAIYSAMCILVILITSGLWLRLHKRLAYLEKRGYVLILFVTLGLICNLFTGPLTRTTNNRESFIQTCSIANLSFILVAPTLTLGACSGVFMFTRRVNLGKVLAKASDPEHNVTLKQLNKAWFRTTNRYTLILAGICYVLIVGICIGISTRLCPELGSEECIITEISNILIVSVLFLSFVALLVLVVYITWSLRTYPDPFYILRSVRNGIGISLLIQVPGFILSGLNLGDPTSESKEEIFFTYGILFDFPILVFYLYFGPYQIYKAFKFDALENIYSDTDLEKVLKDATGKKLFKEHLINEFNYENLVFIDDVEEFKILGSADERILKAKDIYETHFKFSRLNVSYAVTMKIEKMVDNEETSLDMFDEAYDEIWNLLESDPFHRFQQSVVFKVYVGTQTDSSRILTNSLKPRKSSGGSAAVSQTGTAPRRLSSSAETDVLVRSVTPAVVTEADL